MEGERGTRTLRLPAEDQVTAVLTAFAAAVRSGETTAGDEAEVLAQADLLHAIRAVAEGGPARPPGSGGATAPGRAASSEAGQAAAGTAVDGSHQRRLSRYQATVSASPDAKSLRGR